MGGSTGVPTAVIVDDDAAIRRMLRRTLEGHFGFAVTDEFTNGAEVVEGLGAAVPDLIVMDIAMPVMDGVEATREIKKRHPDLSVVAMTGSDDANDVSRMLELGVVGYIVKGAPRQKIIEGLHAAIQGRAFLDERVTRPLIAEYRSLRKDQDRREQALSALDRMKQELIAIVAHEFRTPLTIMKLNSTLLRSGELAGQEDLAAASLEAIEKACDRFAGTISQMTLLADIRGGGLKVDHAVTSMRDVAREACLDFELGSPAGRVIRSFGDCAVLGERERLVQIARSVIDNALKFTRGLVWVRVTQEEHQAVLQVIDEGQGIDPSTLQRIMTGPFSQGDSSSTREVGGLGLSLHVALEYLDLCEGKLEIYTDPRLGTTVRMCIPAVGSGVARAGSTTPPSGATLR